MTRLRKFGIDAPYVPLAFFVAGAAALLIGVRSISAGDFWTNVLFAYGIVLLLSFVVYMHTTMRGKFIIWERVFDQNPVKPGADVLDLGCGRGAVLLEAAKFLGDEGRAVGIDLWQRRDQSGNDMDAAKRNAVLEGVAERVRLVTGDMANLPFDDGAFDYVTAGFSIHNIKSKEGRKKAINEACRVLRAGGTFVVVDMRHTDEYVNELKSIGMQNVQSYNAGANGWWGGPWMSTRVIVAQK